MVTEKLLEFCNTERQRDVVQAILKCGTHKKASEYLGISTRVLQVHIAKVRKNASIQGHAPEYDMLYPTTTTHLVKGTSTLYSDTGAIKQQWVKTNIKKESELEDIKNALDTFLEDHAGKSPFIKLPKIFKEKEQLAVLNIGDSHIGMYTRKSHTGQDFDTKIASKQLKEVCLRLLNNAPNCETIVVNQLGDYYHIDNHAGTTTKGTQLYPDGHLEDIFLVGLQVMTFIVEECLKRFKKVIVRHCAGNHDRTLTLGLRAHQKAYFRNNKRVEIIDSPEPCWVFEWGDTAFLVSHGDAPKPDKLAEYFASKYRKEWVRKHRYVYHGHVHHKRVTNEVYGGCIVESFAGLPPTDVWHDRCGYVSSQSMCLITLDKKHGEIRRSTERI